MEDKYTTWTVGKLFHPARTHWPERAEYNYRSGQHLLTIFFAHPTEAELRAIRREPVELALSVEGSVILLCWRFGTMPWSDASYNWHLVPPEERLLPTLPENERQRELLSLCLVDASNGIIRVLRTVSFSHDFTVALHRAILDQAQQPFDPAAHAQEADQLVARYSSNDLAERAICRCRGGD